MALQKISVEKVYRDMDRRSRRIDEQTARFDRKPSRRPVSEGELMVLAAKCIKDADLVQKKRAETAGKPYRMVKVSRVQ